MHDRRNISGILRLLPAAIETLPVFGRLILIDAMLRSVADTRIACVKEGSTKSIFQTSLGRTNVRRRDA
jgi:hypothetical protein